MRADDEKIETVLDSVMKAAENHSWVTSKPLEASLIVSVFADSRPSRTKKLLPASLYKAGTITYFFNFRSFFNVHFFLDFAGSGLQLKDCE